MGLGPRQQALEEGEVAEHAAGAGVGGDDRVVDAEAGEIVGDLQAPRSATDYEDAIVAGRERSRVRLAIAAA